MGKMLAKKIPFIALTILIEMALTYYASTIMTWSYRDLSFFAATFYTAITIFLTSSGGTTTKLLDTKIQAWTQLNMKLEKSSLKLNINSAVIGSVIYLIVTIFMVFVF